MTLHRVFEVRYLVFQDVCRAVSPQVVSQLNRDLWDVVTGQINSLHELQLAGSTRSAK